MIKDLRYIESDLIASRTKYKSLLEFVDDKPLMKEYLIFVIRTLGDKIKALEGINLSMRNELDLINKELTTLEHFNKKENVPQLIEALGLEPMARSMVTRFKQTHK